MSDLHVAFAKPGGEVHVVDGVTFAIRAGESLAIVGESGSGKSMTALAIVGLVPSPGRVRAERLRLAELDLLRLHPGALRRLRGRRIGFVFQDPLMALNPVMRIGRQIGEVIQLHGGTTRAQARARTLEWLHRVGLPDPAEVADAYPHHLSGGMRQRVLIAIALAGEPELVIADEPTTALDMTVQAQIVGLVQQLRRQLDTALIWISHDLGVVAGLADRVVVMRRGRIVEAATVREIYAAPRHPYTRELMRLARRNTATGWAATPPGGVPSS